MATCPNCGERSGDDARHCPSCGVALVGEAAASRRAGGTVIGIPSPFGPGGSFSQAPTVRAEPGEPATSDSVPLEPATPTASAPARGFGKTVIGLPSLQTAPIALGSPPPPGAPGSLSQGSPPLAPGQLASAPEPRDFGATRQGLGPEAPRPPELEPAGPGRSPSFQRTLLGIATPGIAPTGALPPPPPPLDERPDASPHHTPIPPPPRLPSRAARPSGFPWRLLVLGMVGAAALGGSVALLTKKAPQVTVTAFEVTPEGADRLVLRCEGCGPEQSLALGSARQKLRDGVARLAPPRKLSVGNNPLEVQILDPDGRVAHESELLVPIAFRVETELDGRHADPPFARVVVQAPESSRVRIGDAEVPLSAGRAAVTLPLAEARGETSRVVPISLDVPVEVTTGKTQKRTTARVQAAIVPLELITPARGHVLGSGPLAVSGRTLPGASVRVGELEAHADRAGEFQLTLPTPSAGTLRVIATSPELVARVAEIEVGGSSPTAPPGSFQLGQNTQWSGTVIESRIVGERTTVLMETGTTCSAPPCLARIFYGQRRLLRPGQPLAASGQPISTEPPTLRAYRLD